MITQLMAITLAHRSLLSYAPAAQPKQTPSPLAETPARADDRDQPPLDLMRCPF
jgi:hypothetical protein